VRHYGKAVVTEQKLNDQERLFVDEYLKDLNACQAGIRAGYAENTASKKCPMWVGKSRDLVPENKRHVWDAAQKALAARCERVQVDADYVLKRLHEIAEMDVLDIVDDAGHLKPIKEWPKVWRISIQGIDLTELSGSDGNVALLKKIKWPDKVKNLELLGRHVNVQAFKDNVGLMVSAQEEIDSLMQEIANGASGAAGK
jgi:phage terminase small subunit